jgi:hypothetical protein
MTPAVLAIPQYSKTSCGYLVANGYTTRRKAPQISACLSYFISQFGFIQTFGMISFAI